MAFWQWLTTPAGNGTVDPTINFAEGQSPSSLNDSCRSVMANAAQYRDDTSGLLQGGGTSSAYTVTTNQGFPNTPNNGQSLRFTPTVTNGLGVTLAADGGTAYSIQTEPGVAVQSGAMRAGTPYDVTLNTSVPAWILNNVYIQTGALGFVFPQNFGAVGDGVADDTVPMQNAINAAQSSGTMLFIPNGVYKITSQLTISAAIRIMARGKTLSSLVPVQTTSCLLINTEANVIIEGLTIGYTTPASPGTVAIQVTVPSTGLNNYPVFRDCLINNAQTGLLFTNAQTFLVENCGFFNCQLVSCQVNSVNLPAIGEGEIAGCTFSGQSTVLPSVAHIFHQASSGLRITGNKMIGGAFGYLMALSFGTNLENLVFANNGIENTGTGGVGFGRLGGSGTMTNALIANNIFVACGANAISFAVDSATWFFSLMVNDNIFNSLTFGANNLVEVDRCSGFTISNNLMNSGNAGTVAISTTANASGAVIGPNMKIGTFAANSILSGSTTQIAPT